MTHFLLQDGSIPRYASTPWFRKRREATWDFHPRESPVHKVDRGGQKSARVSPGPSPAWTWFWLRRPFREGFHSVPELPFGRFSEHFRSFAALLSLPRGSNVPRLLSFSPASLALSRGFPFMFLPLPLLRQFGGVFHEVDCVFRLGFASMRGFLALPDLFPT